MEIDPNKPRKLTHDEIMYILSGIDTARASTQEVSANIINLIIRSEYTSLSGIIITPLAIEDLKNDLANKYFRSLIEPGAMVGITAAEALDQHQIQANFNTFHYTGAAKTSGADRYRELLSATSNPKNKSCTIHFNDSDITFEDIILIKRGDFVGVTVDDILVTGADKFDVDTPANIIPDGLPSWYQLYESVTGRKIVISSTMMRLYVDPVKLYAYRLKMSDVAIAIENSDSVQCIYSPVDEAVIDIFPIELKIMSKPESEVLINGDNASLIFLSTVLQPSLKTIDVKGIPGITALYPKTAHVLLIIKEEIQSSSYENVWFLRLDQIRIQLTGITADRLANLCIVAGLEIIPLSPDEAQVYLAVRTPDTESPLTRLNRLIREDKQDEEKYIEEKRKEGIVFPNRPPTAISKAANYIYAETSGSNLRAILARDDVNPNFTFSDDVNEIIDVLGVEAARNFLIREFLNLIQGDGSYVDPRHILLFVDFITNQGGLTAFNYYGMSKLQIGTLAKVTYERPVDIVRDAAATGTLEPVLSTSTSIFVGSTAKIGTGYIDVQIDQDAVSAYKRSKNRTRQRKITSKPDIASFRKALSNINKSALGASAPVINPHQDASNLGTVTTPSPIPVTISNESTTVQVPLKSKPVTSNLLESTVDNLTVTATDCVPFKSTTTLEIGSIPSQMPTLPQPTQTVQLSLYDPAVGAPQELTTAINNAENPQSQLP